MDRQRLINLCAAIAAITVFGLALGLMFPLLSLLMERDGIAPQMIGYNTAMQTAGIVFAGFAVPRAARRWGARLVAIAAALITAAIIMTYPFATFPGWFGLRFVQGMAVGSLFAISEAWVVKYSEGKYRSRILALYTSVLAISFAGGPALITVTGIEGTLPFMIGTVVLVLGTVPLYFVHETTAEPGDASAALSIVGFAPKAPILLAAVALFSIIDAANLSFLPVYGVKKGLDEETASLALTVFIAGNAVLQFPIGWLADHMNKRVVMAGCAIVTAIGSALIPVSFGSFAFWIMLLITGTASAGIYTVALSDLGDRFSGTDLVAGTASFSATWGGGALAGALIAGWSFQRFGPDGLPYTVAAIFLAFILAMFGRAALRPSSDSDRESGS